MKLSAPARLAALATAMGIVATGLVFAGPAAAETDRTLPDGIPLDSSVAYSPDELDTLEGGTRTVLDIEDGVTTTATGTVEGILTIEGVPATTGNSYVAFLLLGPDELFRYQYPHIDTFSGTGAWSASGLPEGTYRVEFYSYEGDRPNNVFWADGEPGDASDFWFGSTSIVLGDGEGYDFGAINVPVRTIDSFRIAGDDRFETSVEISKAAYLDVPVEGVPVVYIVNGRGFADALSAGPAAAENDGVMLLVERTSIPQVVRAELERLNPQRIVAVGGTAVIASSVVSALGGYSSDVDRIAGADRYATSRAIVDDAFGVVEDLFIATGTNFPDALAAGPAASRLGGPVLLVNGTDSSADSATENLLDALGSPNVYVAGGTSAVRSSLAADIEGIVSPSSLTRFAGDDRYETASLINWEIFGEYGSDYALLAAGVNFPDALAGGPLAAIADAPLYLAQSNCVPETAFEDLLFLFTKEVWVLGGTAVLGSRVMQGQVC